MEREDTKNAEEHVSFAKFVLSEFGKSFANVVNEIGNNCVTNKAFCSRAGISFIVCASHRFNLAVKDLMN